MYPIKNIIRSVTRKEDDLLKIITFCEIEEKYNNLLCQTGHEFYLWEENINNNWNKLVEDKPDNLLNLPSSDRIYNSYFDLVVCHNRVEQYNVALSVSQALHIPLVIIDHCGQEILKPSTIFSTVTTPDIKKLHTLQSLINVCVHDKLVSAWPNSSKGSVVINTGRDTDKYKPANVSDEFAIVLDNYIPQSIAQFLAPLNTYTIMGTDREDRTNVYNLGPVFINTWKNINIKLLEAMACGTIPISIETPEISHVIKHNETGFVVKDVDQMINVIEKVKNNEIRNIQQISQNARDYVIENHSMNNFIEKWNQVFQLASNSFYSRGT